MKISKLRSIAVTTVMLGITWSCQKEELNTPSNEENQTEKTSSEGMIRLGKKLENPYSVQNMKTAWENLKKSNPNSAISREELEITTTHLYLKWKPKNNEELSILKREASIDYYPYPLDYELLEGGSYYHDPNVNERQPTYLYCAVPLDKKLPKGVDFEVVAELYIPDEEKDAPKTRKSSFKYVDLLVKEAFRITGNLGNRQNDATVKESASSWRPAGRIRVWDNTSSINNWKPVEGVEVKARRWFTTHKGITDSNGNYSCDGTFKEDANYSLDWERYDFALREGWLEGANINGPKQTGDWNNDFNSGKNMFHARVFMAAYHYYYKNIKGLRRPPENAVFKTQMHIRCFNEDNEESNGNHAPGRRFLGLGSAIKLYNPNREFSAIYGTTIHELAHASHWAMTTSDYNNADDIVSESWARGVQWELTRMVWPSYIPPYGRRNDGNSPNKPSWYNYTGVVQDMIDPIIDYDQVQGYTIREIEDALNGQRTWNGWQNNIINRYNNATENNLSPLFEYWN